MHRRAGAKMHQAPRKKAPNRRPSCVSLSERRPGVRFCAAGVDRRERGLRSGRLSGWSRRGSHEPLDAAAARARDAGTCRSSVGEMAATPWQVFAGAALWGLHMGLTQGLLSKLVADTAPAALRGTAFGIFNLVSGVALLLASVVAGLLWEVVGPSATFFAGAVFAAIAALGILVFRRRPGAV